MHVEKQRVGGVPPLQNRGSIGQTTSRRHAKRHVKVDMYSTRMAAYAPPKYLRAGRGTMIGRTNVVCVWVCFLAGIVLLPTLFVPIPALMDYPNHLTRLWLLMGGASVAPLDQFYLVRWHGIGTNIGIDLAAEAMAGKISPFLLGRVLVALAVLTPPLGAITLNRVLYRKWTPWQLFFFLFWSSETLLTGFLNFQIGLGFALFAAAIDVRLPRSVPRLACRAALSAALLIVHPFALLFYAALTAGLHFGGERLTASPLFARTMRAVAEAAVCAVPVALFLLLHQMVPGQTEEHDTAIHYLPLIFRLLSLLSPLTSYDLRIDILFCGLLAGGMAYLGKSGSFRIHTGLLIVAGVLAAMALCIPDYVFATAWISRRFPIMAVLAGLCAFSIRQPESGSPWRLILVAIFLVGLRTAWIGWNWQASNAFVMSLRQATETLPPGSAVLPMQHWSGATNLRRPGRILGLHDDSYRHLASLVVPWRHVYNPMLFSQSGKQPLTVRPPWDRISLSLGGGLPSVFALNDDRLIPPRQEYMRQWRTCFDYVLVLNADAEDENGTFLPPKELTLVRDSGFAQLYRIHRTQPQCLLFRQGRENTP